MKEEILNFIGFVIFVCINFVGLITIVYTTTFQVRLTELLSKCTPAHSSHQSVTSCWHLLFGWCDEQIDGR